MFYSLQYLCIFLGQVLYMYIYFIHFTAQWIFCFQKTRGSLKTGIISLIIISRSTGTKYVNVVQNDTLHHFFPRLQKMNILGPASRADGALYHSFIAQAFWQKLVWQQNGTQALLLERMKMMIM